MYPRLHVQLSLLELPDGAKELAGQRSQEEEPETLANEPDEQTSQVVAEGEAEKYPS